MLRSIPKLFPLALVTVAAFLCSGCLQNREPTQSEDKPDIAAPADLSVHYALQVIDAEKAGLPKPQLEKSTVTIKSPQTELKDERVSKMATTEGDYTLQEGKWLMAPTQKIERYAVGYIADIKLIAGNSSSIVCPAGYYKIDVDLNRRAGGKFIYFCALGGSAGSALEVRDVKTWGQNSYGTGPGAINNVGGSNGDMNQGAAGKYVFGTHGGTAGFCQTTGIGVITDPILGWPFLSPPAGWTYLLNQTDLNAGAGGDWIYLVLQYRRTDPNRNCLGRVDFANNWYGPTGWGFGS